MADYKKIDVNGNSVFIEQNIYDNSEIATFTKDDMSSLGDGTTVLVKYFVAHNDGIKYPYYSLQARSYIHDDSNWIIVRDVSDAIYSVKSPTEKRKRVIGYIGVDLIKEQKEQQK